MSHGRKYELTCSSCSQTRLVGWDGMNRFRKGITKKCKSCSNKENCQWGKTPPWNRGIKMSQKTRKKVSASLKGRKAWNRGLKGYMSGDKHYNWQGGITPENLKIRNQLDYKEWRKSVFERDNYTCQGCSIRGGYLEADHIKPFSMYPKLRLDLDNGRTLCKPCHRKLGWHRFREKTALYTSSTKADIDNVAWS